MLNGKAAKRYCNVTSILSKGMQGTMQWTHAIRANAGKVNKLSKNNVPHR
jgi:hypothetical protein